MDEITPGAYEAKRIHTVDQYTRCEVCGEYEGITHGLRIPVVVKGKLGMGLFPVHAACLVAALSAGAQSHYRLNRYNQQMSEAACAEDMADAVSV